MTTNIEEQIIADIRRVARALNRTPGDELGRNEYLRNDARFSYYQLYEGGKSYDYYCSKAGFRSKAAVPVGLNGYFERLRKFVDKNGRYPKSTETKLAGIANACVKSGGLHRFIELAVERRVVPDLRPKHQVPSRAAGQTAAESPPLPVLAAESPTLKGSVLTPPPIPARTRRKKWERIDVPAFPYAPQDELSLVALFGILCANKTLPFEILEMNGGKGIDATCYHRESRAEVRVELKKVLSRSTWNHDFDDIDYVVCWENRFPSFPKPVIELCALLKKGMRGDG